jgi:putative membrane protein
MSSGLPAPTVAGLLTHWTLQPVALVALVAVSLWYWRGVRALRAEGGTWATYRPVMFTLGIVLTGWTTCGFAQVYGNSLFWIWTSQQLGLSLILPAILLAGGPLELARLRRPHGFISRLVASGPIRALQSTPSSMAVGLALAIGSFELVLDAVPGIALRLHNSLTTNYFDHRLTRSWAQAPIHDQQLAGSILWCVAELLDLPFLILVFRQWMRADARDAATVDAVLEAERISRGVTVPADERVQGDEPDRDVPWWIADEAMRNRLKRQG